MTHQSSERSAESTRTPGSSRAARGASVNRRSVLRSAAGAAAVVGGLPVVSSVAAAGGYAEVVDIVKDFGADDTGAEPINDALDEAVRDDTKVVFPAGTYEIGGHGFHRWDFGEGVEGERVSNVALVGRGDVTFRPGPDVDNFLFAVWGTGVRLENFRIDETAENRAVGLSHRCEDELVLRDVTFEGVSDTFGVTKLGVGVTDPDGTGLVENVHIPDGAVGYTRHTGLWTFPEHAGHLLIRRCSIEGLSDNAIYASNVAHEERGGLGTVGVENCFFRNNNVSAIRLGSPGSYAKNCTVVFDGYVPEYDTWGAVTARAAWLWSDFEGTLENVTVASDHENGYGFLTYPGQRGAIDLENCRIELNGDGNQAVDFTEGAGAVTIRNSSLTGDAASGAAVEVAGRSLDVRNSCLEQTGADRDGVELRNAAATVENSRLAVTGDAIVADEESDVSVVRPRESGSCPPVSRHHPAQR